MWVCGYPCQVIIGKRVTVLCKQGVRGSNPLSSGVYPFLGICSPLSTLSSQRIYNWTSVRGSGQGVVADSDQKRSKNSTEGNLLQRRCSEMLCVCPVHDLNGISTDLDQLLFPCFCHPFYSVFHLQRQAPRSKFLFEYQAQRPPTFEVS